MPTGAIRLKNLLSSASLSLKLMLVVFHLQKVSGNPLRFIINGTGLLGSFQWKISESNGTSEKVASPAFPVGTISLRVPFLSSHL